MSLKKFVRNPNLWLRFQQTLEARAVNETQGFSPG